jgi:hypothetical protein
MELGYINRCSCGLDGQGLITGRSKRFLHSIQTGPLVKLTTNLHLVLRSRMVWSYSTIIHTSSWSTVSLMKHRGKFTFYFLIIYHIKKTGTMRF